MKRIRGIIWDMGGVFIRNMDPKPRRLLEKQYHLKAGSIDGLVFNSEASKLASIGKISVGDMWRQILKHLRIPFGELSNVMRLFWAGDGADEVLLNTIRDLKKEYATGLLSNAWKDARTLLTEKYHCMDAFNEAVFSAEVGCMKPDSRIYLFLLQKMQLDAEETVFIDDFVENVEGARRLGMSAIHFIDREQALAELFRLLK